MLILKKGENRFLHFPFSKLTLKSVCLDSSSYTIDQAIDESTTDWIGVNENPSLLDLNRRGMIDELRRELRQVAELEMRGEKATADVLLESIVIKLETLDRMDSNQVGAIVAEAEKTYELSRSDSREKRLAPRLAYVSADIHLDPSFPFSQISNRIPWIGELRCFNAIELRTTFGIETLCDYDLLIIDFDNLPFSQRTLLTDLSLTATSAAIPPILCVSGFTPFAIGLVPICGEKTGWLSKPFTIHSLSEHLIAMLKSGYFEHIETSIMVEP